MRVRDLDLSREDIEVLREVASHDDRGATTSDVMDVLGWAEESHHITYRFDKLEDRGYVETAKDPERGPTNQLPPRVARVTDSGHQLVGEVEINSSESELEEKVEKLAKQVSRMRDTYGDVKQRIVDIEEEIKDLDADVDDMAEDVRNLRRSMDSEDDRLAGALDFDD